jgi:hypothetical protein
MEAIKVINKKIWQKPVIKAELPIEKTLKGALAGDGGTMS